MSIYQTLKKYIFILSNFFIILISLHLVLVYLYEGSKLFPTGGGVVNIGFVAEPPSLNPALYGLDSTNDYILRFLSRSLLSYNVETKQMEGDLANCNLGKDFGEIKCYVKNDGKWSDGTAVTKEDILATYRLFQETDINKPIKNILANITIQDQGDYIGFSGKADILILDIFLYPIIRKDMAEKIRNSTFSSASSVFSGPYVFGKRETDDRSHAETISLVKNADFSGKDIYIEKYVCKFFRDKDSLLANKDSLNLIYPNDKIDGIPSPRFNTYNYLLPQYITLFLNSEKLSPGLRTILLSRIGDVKYESLDEKNGRIMNNPFFSDEIITPKNTNQKNIEGIMKDLGYYKKESLLEILLKQAEETKPKVSENNTYFITPTNKKYATTKEMDILISGNVPNGVTGVYINDYRLKTFTSGAKKFYFRAKDTLGTLKDGANTYLLSFEVGGKKIAKETLTLYRSSSQEELDAKEKEYLGKISSEKTNSELESKKREQTKKTLTEKIVPLDSAYYYNRDLKKMSLNLSFTNQSSFFKPIAQDIQSTLEQIGIEMTIQELKTEDIQNIVANGEKKYDMILTGINLGLFDYNIFPFFHSGQAEKGFNFSKMKNVALDILLEKLKSSQLNSESLNYIKSEILDILKKENVVFTLYSPYNSFFIDKNLKQVKTVNVIPYSSSIYDLGENMYLKEGRTLDINSKSFIGFFYWILEENPFALPIKS